MSNSLGTGTQASLNNNERFLYNRVYADLDPADRALLPLYGSRDDQVKIGEAVKGTPGVVNGWFDTLVQKVIASYVSDIVTNNPFGILEKDPVMYGGVIEDTFIDRQDLQDFDVFKAPQRQLAIRKPRMFTDYHVPNFSGQYVTTPISRQDAVGAFSSEGGLMSITDRIVASLSTSWDLDNRDMYNYTFGNAFFNGATKNVVVPESGDKDADAKALAEAIGRVARQITSPRRDFNQRGVRSATRNEDLFLVTDAASSAAMAVHLFAPAHNLEFVKLPGHLIEIDSFDNIDWEQFETYIENTGGFKEYSAAQKTFLGEGKLKAFLFDGGWIRTHLQSFESGTFQIPMGSAFTANLNVSKVYGLRSFANAVSFSSVPWTRPTDYDFTVTATSASSTVRQITLKAPENLVFEWVHGDETDFTVSDDTLIADISVTSADLKIVVNGTEVTVTIPDISALAVGDTVSFT